MNNFGGDWTSQKFEIITSYTQAYLNVVCAFPNCTNIKFKL
jgi:hypothetical protein